MSKTSKVHLKIASNIRKLRQESSMSQEKLAYEAGLNRAYIGYIERGERKPRVDTLARIAKALRVEIKELFIFD